MPPLVAVCPHCKKAYTVRKEHVGQESRCRSCKQTFTITLGEMTRPSIATMAPPSAAPAQNAAESMVLCPVCQSAVGAADDIHPCTDCKTRHHRDCWDYNKGCGLYGCKQAPETEKLRDVEIPASFWGQTDKHCPRCKAVIQAAALRCRHCGTTFENARPQEATEFAAQQSHKQTLAVHWKLGIALLVAAVIPCTAPLAAVVGIVWYVAARRSIAALPPMQATICRLAVGLAVAVSVILLVIAGIYSLHSG